MAKRQMRLSELGFSIHKQPRLEARSEAAHVRKDMARGVLRQIDLNCGTSASAAIGRATAKGPLQCALVSRDMSKYSCEDLGVAPLLWQDEHSEDDQKNIFVEGADLGQSAPGSLAVTHEFNNAKNMKIKPLDISRPDIYTQKSGLSEEMAESHASQDSNNNPTETTCETPPLLRAVVMRAETAVKRMLAEGAGTGTADTNGHTALHMAAEYNNCNAVRILLSKGADPNACCIRGRTPLHIAAAKGYLEVCDHLICAGACPCQWDKDNITPLHEVVRIGDLELLKVMTCVRVSHDISLLVMATKQENVEMCQRLLEYGWSPCFTFGGKIPPLYYAAKLGNKSIVRLLLEYGDFPLAAGPEGRTPLHLAALYGHDHIIPLMTPYSAHLSPVDTNGLTPLHLAAGHGHVKTVKILLKLGAAVDLKDGTGCTALGLAAAAGWKEVCKCLLEAESSPLDPETSTPALHAAARAGHTDVVQLLLNAGAPPNLRDPELRTPLHSTAQGDQVYAMRLLVYCGATIHAEDKDGRTPAQLATTDKFREMLRMADRYLRFK